LEQLQGRLVIRQPVEFLRLGKVLSGNAAGQHRYECNYGRKTHDKHPENPLLHLTLADAGNSR
jgi:hypothetical protein